MDALMERDGKRARKAAASHVRNAAAAAIALLLDESKNSGERST